MKNTYLFSTSLKSFGFIISSHDKDSSSDNFFELFSFDATTTEELYRKLNDNTVDTIFARDLNENGFLFFSNKSKSSLFAVAKMIDMNSGIASTIIQKHFPDEVFCIGTANEENSYEHYIQIHDTIYNTKQLVSSNSVADYFKINKNTFTSTEIKSEYVFCDNGFNLFLSFVYLFAKTHNDADNPHISVHNIDGAKIIKIKLNCADEHSDNLTSKLNFLRDTLDAQNLSLFYEIDREEIKILFLPYYIDDGLFGVKAPINFKKI